MSELSLARLPSIVLSQVAGFLVDLLTFLAFTSSCRTLRAAVRPRHYAALVAVMCNRTRDASGRVRSSILFSMFNARVPPTGFFPDFEDSGINDLGPVFYPFLRPDETVITEPQQSSSGGSPFFFAILEDVKKLDLQGGTWIPNSFYNHTVLLQAMRWDLLSLAKWIHAHGVVPTWGNPLLYAARSGNIDIVRWAVQEKLFNGPNASRFYGGDVYTPVDEAYRANKSEIVNYLLEARLPGASSKPELSYLFTSNFRPTSEKAVETTDLEFIKKMLAGGQHITPVAACAGRALNIAVTRLLHHHGMDLLDAFKSACETASVSASENIEYLDLLLSWGGDDNPNRQLWIDSGLNSAFWACKLEVVQHLLSLGAQFAVIYNLKGFASGMITSKAKEEFYFALMNDGRGRESLSNWAHLPLSAWTVTDKDDAEVARKKEELSARLDKERLAKVILDQKAGIETVVGTSTSRKPRVMKAGFMETVDRNGVIVVSDHENGYRRRLNKKLKSGGEKISQRVRWVDADVWRWKHRDPWIGEGSKKRARPVESDSDSETDGGECEDCSSREEGESESD
ncbi:uncharacterized protein EV422DRAFT_567790 [Fimicolochytrium jonesii]|uniref:uncharacterized protein n=1 Tax=Fimicolochytrium jonesii TaxID=1396493 RepID=UPI0022FE3EB2|nr:uncharacterized protein EV422DRAFT_567790 [Fimicolochytrium jonesii]KAI8820360.1 hypothetical protein EV422DRAFT_567790 [Fimicolochytrium jonesii]